MSGLLWGTLEIFTAFVIACLPSTRLFLQHFFPVLATKFTTAVSSNKRTVQSSAAGTIVELQDAARFGAGGPGGDRRSKAMGPTTQVLQDIETDQTPLRRVEDGETRGADAV